MLVWREKMEMERVHEGFHQDEEGGGEDEEVAQPKGRREKRYSSEDGGHHSKQVQPGWQTTGLLSVC